MIALLFLVFFLPYQVVLCFKQPFPSCATYVAPPSCLKHVWEGFTISTAGHHTNKHPPKENSSMGHLEVMLLDDHLSLIPLLRNTQTKKKRQVEHHSSQRQASSARLGVDMEGSQNGLFALVEEKDLVCLHY